jgi:hypothetical protein
MDWIHRVAEPTVAAAGFRRYLPLGSANQGDPIRQAGFLLIGY